MSREQNPTFPFHYGKEAEQYTFYQIPKCLFTEPIFDGLSTDAKLLYGLLLDRMQLSIKNKWMDDEGKVYIYYTIASIMEALRCGNKKAGQLLAELDDQNGIGLITRVRQGLGKPDKIFVHKCMADGMLFGQVQKCQTDISGSVITTCQEMSKGHRNDTEYNNTNINQNDSILSEEGIGSEGDWYEQYRSYFMDQLSFKTLLIDNPYKKDRLYELLELLTEVCSSKKKYIRVAGEDKPASVVKSRLMKLNSEHIRFVMTCMEENTTKVKNIRQYLLAALYNAPTTIDSYYAALVNHDLYGGGG